MRAGLHTRVHAWDGIAQERVWGGVAHACVCVRGGVAHGRACTVGRVAHVGPHVPHLHEGVAARTPHALHTYVALTCTVLTGTPAHVCACTGGGRGGGMLCTRGCSRERVCAWMWMCATRTRMCVAHACAMTTSLPSPSPHRYQRVCNEGHLSPRRLPQHRRQLPLRVQRGGARGGAPPGALPAYVGGYGGA